MKNYAILRLSRMGLAVNGTRTILSLAGVALGIAAVTIVTTMGFGSRQYIVGELEGLGGDLLIVKQAWTRTVYEKNKKLDMTAAGRIEARGASVRYAVPALYYNAEINDGVKKRSLALMGTTELYTEVRNIRIKEGRFLRKEDVDRKRKVCVMESGAAGILFPGEDPVGNSLAIRGLIFRVVGVIDEENSKISRMIESAEPTIIPITVLHGILNTDAVNMLFVQARKGLARQAEGEIREVLGQTNAGDASNKIESFDSYIRMTSRIIDNVTITVSAIAIVSLVVGGIGIMNVMISSISERIKEIGIYLAVGARRRDIFTIFFSEAVLICCAGGVAGVLAGTVLSYAGMVLLGMEFRLQAGALAVSAVFSVLLGISVGIYPALKASKLQPIDALRFE